MFYFFGEPPFFSENHGFTCFGKCPDFHLPSGALQYHVYFLFPKNRLFGNPVRNYDAALERSRD